LTLFNLSLLSLSFLSPEDRQKERQRLVNKADVFKIEDFQPVDAWKLNYSQVGKVNRGKHVCCQQVEICLI